MLTMAVYTKKGDKGDTYLYGDKKVKKSNLIIESIGSLDELQSFVGLVKNFIKNKKTKHELLEIEKNLYLIMAYLSGANTNLDFIKEKISEFEKTIDKIEKNHSPIKKFILPGKTLKSAWFHVLRTICRRCERVLVYLTEKQKDKNLFSIIAYLNRLSDLFFIYSLD